MKKLLSFVLIGLFAKSCNIGEYSPVSASMYFDYADNCTAEDFRISFSLGFYRYGQYNEEWKDNCGAYLYVQNTTGANGYLNRKIDYETGIFLLNTEGIEDIYGFDNTDRFGNYTFSFTKEFTIEASLFDEKNGWISFVSGVYRLDEEEKYSRSFRQSSVNIPYLIDDNGIVKFKRHNNDNEQPFSVSPVTIESNN